VFVEVLPEVSYQGLGEIGSRCHRENTSELDTFEIEQ